LVGVLDLLHDLERGSDDLPGFGVRPQRAELQGQPPPAARQRVQRWQCRLAEAVGLLGEGAPPVS